MVKWKKVKSFYYSLLDKSTFKEEYEMYKKSNPEKLKAIKLAKKVEGVIRTKYYPEDDGYEYSVYVKEKWENQEK